MKKYSRANTAPNQLLKTCEQYKEKGKVLLKTIPVNINSYFEMNSGCSCTLKHQFILYPLGFLVAAQMHSY